MKYLYSLIFVTAIGFLGHAQTGVGIPNGNPSAVVDLTAANKGVLIPRVALSSLTDAATITKGNVDGLLVFNTQTVSDLTPGFYYWFNSKWNKILVPGDVEANLPATTNDLRTEENTITSNVNGELSSAAVITSNQLLLDGGNLISSVNGIESDPLAIVNTAGNGLTKTDGNIEIGGLLTKPTVITTDATNTLALEGIQSSTTPDDDTSLVIDTNGVVKKTSFVPVASYSHQTQVLNPDESENMMLPKNAMLSHFIVGVTDNCGSHAIVTFSAYNDELLFTGGKAYNSLYSASYTYHAMVLTVFAVDCDKAFGDTFNFNVTKTGNLLRITNKGGARKVYNITQLAL